MKKQVIVAPGVYEPEALVRESLDGAFWHFVHSLKKCPAALSENITVRLLHRKHVILSGGFSTNNCPQNKRVGKHSSRRGSSLRIFTDTPHIACVSRLDPGREASLSHSKPFFIELLADAVEKRQQLSR